VKYLTIDTATKITALALAENGRVVSEGFLHTGKTHSERLIPMLDQLLNAADWDLKELDFLAVTRGPGSFTGIRIGIATAQGLAQVLKIPLIGLSTLDTLSWTGWGRAEDIVVILDARKNEWYYARYRWAEKRVLLDGPKAVAPQIILEQFKQENTDFFFAGDAVCGAEGILREALGEKAHIPLMSQYLPRGAYAVQEAWQEWQSGEPGKPEPFYLRMSEAEVNYRKKHQEKTQ